MIAEFCFLARLYKVALQINIKISIVGESWSNIGLVEVCPLLVLLHILLLLKFILLVLVYFIVSGTERLCHMF